MAVAEVDVSVVVRCRDDEERIGHTISRLVEHLQSLGLRFEVLVADEGSGDNTVAVATLLRRQCKEIEVVHGEETNALFAAAQRAHGKTLILLDARADAGLSPLGFVLGRVNDDLDLFVMSGRYVVLRRTRTWRAFDALHQRDWPSVERRLVERARELGLRHSMAELRSQRRRLRDLLPLPSLKRSFAR